MIFETGSVVFDSAQLRSISRGTSKFGWSRTKLDLHGAIGQSYTAKLDGADAPMKGDPGVTRVSVKMMGKDTLEETDKRDGKVIAVFKMKLASDGKTAKASYDDKQSNRTTDFVDVTKQ